ncbi:DUF6636 domain-containing protein [Paractinoplanes hotanensis]|uniref:Uncharacterized protein n=1 Tax=Paractinoplanes hotanensis TaxID=2906497 RepID=A0ABT0YB78_9ACTN|nr:DUF6636 domain-containing protein [Actinoplanes hotanensis]MCM4083302.1 hypothetical protein [Actinoplanes hotanensis]
MAPKIRGIVALALLGALSGCSPSGSSAGDGPDPDPSAFSSANVGFGGPAPVEAAVVDEAMFRTPSQNIACALTDSEVRCDIVRKAWKPPAKPADCELDWGNGLAVIGGRATFTCVGDTLVGTSETTLEYGQALRSGSVRCDSENLGLTCKDDETGHGFTLAVSRYTLF